MEQKQGYGTVPPPYNQYPQPGQPGQPGPTGPPGPPGQPYPQGQPVQQQYGYQQPASQTVIVSGQPARIAGGCLTCGGVLREEFSVVGIILAIVFFPIGILCCLMMTERRCANCGR